MYHNQIQLNRQTKIDQKYFDFRPKIFRFSTFNFFSQFFFQEKANSTGLASSGSSSNLSQTPPDSAYLKTEPKVEQIEDLPASHQTPPDLSSSPAITISQPSVIPTTLMQNGHDTQTSPLTGSTSTAPSSVSYKKVDIFYTKIFLFFYTKIFAFFT